MLSSARCHENICIIDLAPASLDQSISRERGETAYLDLLLSVNRDKGCQFVVNFSATPTPDGWTIADFLHIMETVYSFQAKLPVFGLSDRGLTRLRQRCSGSFIFCADEDSALAVLRPHTVDTGPDLCGPGDPI
jgi:hypothetical protein